MSPSSPSFGRTNKARRKRWIIGGLVVIGLIALALGLGLGLGLKKDGDDVIKTTTLAPPAGDEEERLLSRIDCYPELRWSGAVRAGTEKEECEKRGCTYDGSDGTAAAIPC